MPSTFTTNKTIEQPAAGSYNDTWSVPVNLNWAALDNALGGSTTISVTGVTAGAYALALAQYQPPNIIFTGVLSANLVYQLPTGVGGLWTVFNNTSGAFSLTFASAGGGSQGLAQGKRTFLVCDGTNVQAASTPLASANPTAQVGLVAINGTAPTYMLSDSAPALSQNISPTWAGIHTFNNFVNLNFTVTLATQLNVAAGGVINAAAASLVSVPTLAPGANNGAAASTQFVATSFAPLANPALTGVPTAPTAAAGTNTTRLATTAFVTNAVNVGGSLTANGWRSNPDGSIEQWGVTPSSGTSASVTFPTEFPTACFSIVVTPIGTNSTYNITAPAASPSGFTIAIGASGTQFSWRAIGK